METGDKLLAIFEELAARSQVFIGVALDEEKIIKYSKYQDPYQLVDILDEFSYNFYQEIQGTYNPPEDENSFVERISIDEVRETVVEANFSELEFCAEKDLHQTLQSLNKDMFFVSWTPAPVGKGHLEKTWVYRKDTSSCFVVLGLINFAMQTVEDDIDDMEMELEDDEDDTEDDDEDEYFTDSFSPEEEENGGL